MSPATSPAGTRYLETVFRSSLPETAAATPNPQPPVRKTNGNGTTIGWMGCACAEAVLFMHAACASDAPAYPAAYAFAPIRSRISLSVEAAACSGRLLM